MKSKPNPVFLDYEVTNAVRDLIGMALYKLSSVRGYMAFIPPDNPRYLMRGTNHARGPKRLLFAIPHGNDIPVQSRG